MVLGNYVVLEPGIKKSLHFKSHFLGPKEITDPASLHLKSVNTLEFQVDQEDGRAVDKAFSVTSEKLARQLAPFLPEREYVRHLFSITKSGSGYKTEYAVRVQPLT